jgi:alpha-1,3-rhamnosyltransferase
MLKQKFEDSPNTVPLVSITVITYNSSRFVLETLQSAKQQTYRNIELIISDDCSTDETVEICGEWVEKNKDRFVRTKIITSDYNTGIPANSNRAIRASQGEWIKIIAGDDILLPNCVTDYVDYVTSAESSAKIIFSKAQRFCEKKGEKQTVDIFPGSDIKAFFSFSAEKQFEKLLKWNFMPAPTAFYSRDLFMRYPYNEMYRFMEDYPQWLRLTFNGVKLYFMDSVTVMYRISQDSVTDFSGQYYSSKLEMSTLLFFWNEKIRYLGNTHAEICQLDRQKLLIHELAFVFLGNRKSRIHNFIYRIMKALVFRLAKYKGEQ